MTHSSSAPHGGGDFAGFEAQRRNSALSQPSHRRAFRARPSMMEDVRAGRYGATQPVEAHLCAPPPYAYVPSPPEQARNLPVQGAVNRSDTFEPTTRDIEIRDPSGNLLEILRFPVRGRYGSDPNEVAWFPDYIDPGSAVCGILAPYAALRCFAMGGAW